MPDLELVALLEVQWLAVNHRFARARLEHLGWVQCGQGDWAYAYRSPGGRLVARVSPFEPGYGYFVDLCQRCAGNRYVPRIDLATELEGGGHLAVLEYLAAPDRETIDTFLWRWQHPARADTDLWALRRAVDTIDGWGRQNLPGWVGVDIGDRHVLLSSDGNPKVIDLFGVDFRTFVINDPRAFARWIPPEHRRYVLDMPDLQADDHPAEYLRRVRTALAQAAAEGRPAGGSSDVGPVPGAG